MKVFCIDKFNTLNKYIKNLDKDSIEIKENCKFRMTKCDVVITSDENSFEGLEKLKNIIILVKNKDYKFIWKLVNSYKTIDIIDINMPEEYILNRIKRVVSEDI